MTYTFGERSLERLSHAHPDLRRVFMRAIGMSPLDFTILEVLRTPERQRLLVAQGASQTMRSRHLPHPVLSHAVDAAPVINGQVTWDWPLYHQLAPIIKDAARLENVPIEWGGDWRSFKDGPHWQLSWAAYP